MAFKILYCFERRLEASKSSEEREYRQGIKEQFILFESVPKGSQNCVNNNIECVPFPCFMISTFLQKPMHKIAKFSFFIDPLLLHFTIRCFGFLSFPFVFHPTLEISARAMNVVLVGMTKDY